VCLMVRLGLSGGLWPWGSESLAWCWSACWQPCLSMCKVVPASKKYLKRPFRNHCTSWVRAALAKPSVNERRIGKGWLPEPSLQHQREHCCGVGAGPARCDAQVRPIATLFQICLHHAGLTWGGGLHRSAAVNALPSNALAAGLTTVSPGPGWLG
jgi:hypothetical protein